MSEKDNKFSKYSKRGTDIFKPEYFPQISAALKAVMKENTLPVTESERGRYYNDEELRQATSRFLIERGVFLPDDWVTLTHGPRQGKWDTLPNLDVTLKGTLWTIRYPSELRKSIWTPESHKIRMFPEGALHDLSEVNIEDGAPGESLEVIVLLSSKSDESKFQDGRETHLNRGDGLVLIKDLREKTGQFEHYSRNIRRLFYVLSDDIDMYKEEQIKATSNQ